MRRTINETRVVEENFALFLTSIMRNRGMSHLKCVRNLGSDQNKAREEQFSRRDLELHRIDGYQEMEIQKIDVESKTVILPENGLPKNWYRGVSFLNRKDKVDACVLLSKDVDELLRQTMTIPRVHILWAHIYQINKYPSRLHYFKSAVMQFGNGDRKHKYHELPSDVVFYGVESLIDYFNYCSNFTRKELNNEELILQILEQVRRNHPSKNQHE